MTLVLLVGEGAVVRPVALQRQSCWVAVENFQDQQVLCQQVSAAESHLVVMALVANCQRVPGVVALLLVQMVPADYQVVLEDCPMVAHQLNHPRDRSHQEGPKELKACRKCQHLSRPNPVVQVVPLAP